MILKIDTTNTNEVKVGLVSAKDGIQKKLTVKRKFGSQALLPAIVKILKKNNLQISDISHIEVNPGPGSFTGTRVGVSVANALGFALDVPVNGKKGKIVVPIYEKSKFD